MSRTVNGLAIGLVSWAVAVAGQAADNGNATSARPKAQGLLAADAPSFIKRFDKNGDGVLTKDELPERLAKFFDRADLNQDGKLDAQEVQQMLQVLRRRMAQAGNRVPGKPDAGRFLALLFERLDTNGDGKISREEARGPLKEHFDRLDLNKDGFLDKDELRKAAGRLQALRDRAAKGEQPRRGANRGKADFAELDQNADGRLTPDELKGTPFDEQFEAMDLNKDGRIDRKEWAAFQNSRAESQLKKDK